MMRNRNLFRHLVAIIAISLTFHASTEKCDCKSTGTSSGTSTTPPPNPTVSVKNLYSSPLDIYYEIWTGTSLEYREGVVYGNSLSRAASGTVTYGSTASSVATISYDGSFLIVIGVLDSGQQIYVTNQAVTNLTSSRTMTVNSNGTVN